MELKTEYRLYSTGLERIRHPDLRPPASFVSQKAALDWIAEQNPVSINQLGDFVILPVYHMQ